MTITIRTIASIDPRHRFSTDEIIRAAEQFWLSHIDERSRSAALKIMKGAEIRERYSICPLETVFSDLSFQEKNDIYIEAVKEMAEAALLKACEQADISPQKLDYLITTSCTGFMIPSVDAYLVDKLGLKQNIVRMPITEMGCAGGTSAMIYATKILRGHPGANAAVICVEAPSITFQKQDLSMENLVSTAIFADGAAAAILTSDSLPKGPRILDTDMYHFPNSTHLMGYRLLNSGLKIVLDRDVPNAIAEHFPRFLYPFLEKNRLTLDDVNHFIFHPGGKKILQQVESILKPSGKNVENSKAILKNRGNLSSATVLYVLERAMAEAKEGDSGYMLAFGPGFSAQSLLLEW